MAVHLLGSAVKDPDSRCRRFGGRCDADHVWVPGHYHHNHIHLMGIMLIIIILMIIIIIMMLGQPYGHHAKCDVLAAGVISAPHLLTFKNLILQKFIFFFF